MASDGGSGHSSNMVHPAAAVTKLAGTLHKGQGHGRHKTLRNFFVERASTDIVLACTRGISDHFLADDTPVPSGAAEWPLIFVLGNFVSDVMTTPSAKWATFGGPQSRWSWGADSSILRTTIYLDYFLRLLIGLATTVTLRSISLSPDTIILRPPSRRITKPILI